MKTLQDNISEALFSKKGIDAEKTTNKITDDLIKKYISADDEQQSVDVEVDGNKLTIYLKSHPDYYISHRSLLLGCVPAGFPFKISKVIIVEHDSKNATYEYGLWLGIFNCKVKSLSELFTDDFEIVTPKGRGRLRNGLEIQIQNCPNLTSLEGCPQKDVSDFRINNCKSLTSLDGMPEKINRICDYTYGITLDETMDSISMGPKNDNVPAKDFYNHLDPTCKLAKSVKATMRREFGIEL